MDSIFRIGRGLEISTPHETHDLFTARSNIFDIHGQVTIEKVTLLSTEIHSSHEDIDISKDKCFYKCLFNSCKSGLQTHLSLNCVTTKRSGIIALKLIFGHATEADRELVRNEE